MAEWTRWFQRGWMKRTRARKCRYCGQLYHPDYRTTDRQQYCSAVACRQASHCAAQRRWWSQPENQDYYRGADQVRRVQAWRKAHPGYWKKKRMKAPVALHDESSSQPVECQGDSTGLNAVALQDEMLVQPAVMVGLIASLTGSALPDEIANSLRRFQAHGQIILGKGPGMKTSKGAGDGVQEDLVPGAAAAGAGAFQLGGSPAGAG
jgi:hypothetical protein